MSALIDGSRQVSGIYGEDLAYAHNAGFGGFAQAAAEQLLKRFHTAPHPIIRILDIGCGSGISTRIFASAGFSVVGIEASAAMVDLARKAVPNAEFIQSSAYDIELPNCDAIVAIGEVFNYHSEPEQADELIRKFFRSAHSSLNSGGLLVFDVVSSGEPSLDARSRAEGEGWMVLCRTTEDNDDRTIIREIDTFRADRHTRERHSIRVFETAQLRNWLTEPGFEVEISKAYGALPLLPRRIAVAAQRK